jgi:predicted HicB family RNase H-like nuclease
MGRIRAGLRIPYDLNTWLIFEAQKQGISKNALILAILWDRKKQEKTG